MRTSSENRDLKQLLEDHKQRILDDYDILKSNVESMIQQTLSHNIPPREIANLFLCKLIGFEINIDAVIEAYKAQLKQENIICSCHARIEAMEDSCDTCHNVALLKTDFHKYENRLQCILDKFPGIKDVWLLDEWKKDKKKITAWKQHALEKIPVSFRSYNESDANAVISTFNRQCQKLFLKYHPDKNRQNLDVSEEITKELSSMREAGSLRLSQKSSIQKQLMERNTAKKIAIKQQFDHLGKEIDECIRNALRRRKEIEKIAVTKEEFEDSIKRTDQSIADSRAVLKKAGVALEENQAALTRSQAILAARHPVSPALTEETGLQETSWFTKTSRSISNRLSHWWPNNTHSQSLEASNTPDAATVEEGSHHKTDETHKKPSVYNTEQSSKATHCTDTENPSQQQSNQSGSFSSSNPSGFFSKKPENADEDICQSPTCD